MISIVNYRERYLSDIETMNRDLAQEIRYLRDVVADSVCVALRDGEFAGAGLLALAQPSLAEGEKAENVYYRAEFQALPGIEEEAEASITLLEELMYRFDRLKPKDGPVPVLRVWVKATETAYSELLFDEGFRIGGVMTVMERTIEESEEEESYADESESFGTAYSPVYEPGEIALMRLECETDADDDTIFREFCDEESEWQEYFSVSARSFGEGQSENELRFRLQQPEGHVWLAVTDGQIAASLTTWPLGKGIYATESIFCAPEYRRRGITTRLMNHVFGILGETGARSARLTVYGDNLPAIRLYRKLGYSVAGELLEMHYFGKADRAL